MPRCHVTAAQDNTPSNLTPNLWKAAVSSLCTQRVAYPEKNLAVRVEMAPAVASEIAQVRRRQRAHQTRIERTVCHEEYAPRTIPELPQLAGVDENTARLGELGRDGV